MMTNVELMEAVGSKEGSDPMPPRHHMRLMISKNAVEQAMGWLYYCTIRYPKRTPYATDELGRILARKDLEAFYSWSYKKTLRTWKKVEQEGWAKEADDGKLWLRADFAVAFPVVTEGGPSDGPPVDPVAVFIGSLPPYQQTVIVNLPRAKQESLVTNLQTHKEWADEVKNDAMMAARDETDPYRVRIFEAFGIPVIVGKKLEKARATCSVQLELFGEPLLNLPKPVNGNGHTNGTNGKNGNGNRHDSNPTPARQKPANRHASTARAAKPDPETGCTPEEMQTPQYTTEEHAVLEAMRKFAPSADLDGAARLIRGCRTNSPQCTTVSICEGIDLKGPFVKGKTTMVGFLIRSVPKLFADGALPPRVEEPEEPYFRRQARKEVSTNG